MANNISENSNSNVDYIIIDANQFVASLTENTSQETLKIENYRIINSVVLKSNLKFYRNIECNNCHFEEDLVFNGCEFLGVLSFNLCSSNGTFNFNRGIFERLTISDFIGNNIIFQGGEYKNRVWLTWKTLSSFSIFGGFFETGLLIREFNNTEKQTVEPLCIFIIFLEKDSILGSITVLSIPINYLVLKGLVKDSNLRFDGIKVNKIEFSLFTNDSKLRFSKITAINKKAVFEISDSDMGKCELVNLNFENFDFYIQNSIIVGINAINTKWFKKIANKTINHINDRENYRQLKQAMLTQNDKIQALEFEKDELNSYYKSLSWKSKDFFDKVVLATNWTNNQGQNWVRPLVLILITTIFFYTLIKYNLGFTHFNLDYLAYDIGRFISIINPIHLTNLFGVDIKSNDYAYALDSVYRLVSAYLLFQLISAFRKFFNRK